MNQLTDKEKIDLVDHFMNMTSALRVKQCFEACEGIENPAAIRELIKASQELETHESVANLVALSKALAALGVK